MYRKDSFCYPLLCQFILLIISHGICAVEHVHEKGNAAPIFSQQAVLQLEALPACQLKTELGKLSPKAREHALRRMREYSIGQHDLSCLHADAQGEMFFQCSDVPDEEPEGAAALIVAPGAASIWDSGFTPSGAVAIASPPIFNSKLGATNIAYIDFNGDVITNTAWNNHSIGGPTITARAFNTDGDASTFSNTEQTRIYQVWQRMAEDFAAYDINITTDPFYDDQNNRGPTIAQVLISHNGDFNSDNAGGRAYVGVFGYSNYATYYSPALVYYNKLSSRADYIAEAASHELGHNLGLNHDGTSSLGYYNGHGSGVTSWGPIMGTGYNRNVSQWSNGEYYDANNSQDDEARLNSKLGLRLDDHANSIGGASALHVSGGTTIASTHADNQGIILGPADPDVFKFATAAGSISLRVDPFVVGTNTRGGNLDVKLRLMNGAGAEIAVANPTSTTYAVVSTTVTAGTYYLEISGVGFGSPLTAGPSGFVDRFSQGQYFVSGTLINPATDLTAPTATAVASNIETGGLTTHDIVVTYIDNVSINVSSLSNANVRVTGPNGFNQLASFINVNVNSNGNPRVATYRINAPGGTWDFVDNGEYTVAIEANQVTDVNANIVPADVYTTFTVTTDLPPNITSTLYVNGTRSVAFSYSIIADNDPTSFSVDSLPSGLNLNTSSGVISGVPNTAGTYYASITASNAYGNDTESLRIIINPPAPEITSSLTANGSVGAAFNFTLTASNTPTSFTASGLPTGLSLVWNTGVISGVPSTAGTYNVTVRAYNAGGSDSEVLVLTIAPPDVSAPIATSVALIVKGRVSTDTTELTLNGVHAVIQSAGVFQLAVPVNAGSSTITIIATDSAGNQSTRSIDVSSTASIPPVVN